MTDLQTRAQELAIEGLSIAKERLENPNLHLPCMGSYPLRAALLLQEIANGPAVIPLSSFPLHCGACGLTAEDAAVLLGEAKPVTPTNSSPLGEPQAPVETEPHTAAPAVADSTPEPTIAEPEITVVREFAKRTVRIDGDYLNPLALRVIEQGSCRIVQWQDSFGKWNVYEDSKVSRWCLAQCADPEPIILDPRFWDCDCPGEAEFRYIRPKSQRQCPVCHSRVEDCSDSRVSELLAAGLIERSPYVGEMYQLTKRGKELTGWPAAPGVALLQSASPTVPPTVADPAPAYGDGQPPKPTHQHGDKGLLNAIRKCPPSEAVLTIVRMLIQDRRTPATQLAHAVGCKPSEVRTLVRRADYHLGEYDLLALPERKERYLELLEAEAREASGVGA